MSTLQSINWTWLFNIVTVLSWINQTIYFHFLMYYGVFVSAVIILHSIQFTDFIDFPFQLLFVRHFLIVNVRSIGVSFFLLKRVLFLWTSFYFDFRLNVVLNIWRVVLVGFEVFEELHIYIIYKYNGISIFIMHDQFIHFQQRLIKAQNQKAHWKWPGQVEVAQH